MPEVGLPHQVAAAQLLAPALGDDAAGLQHVAAVGQIERGRHVLLDEEHGQPLRLVQRRSESMTESTRRGMIPRLGSSSMRKRGRDISARAMASIWASPPLSVPARWLHALPQHREERENALEHLPTVRRVAVAEAAEAQVLGDAQPAEQAAALGHERHAQLHAVGRVHRADAPGRRRRSRRLRLHEPGDGLEQRRLARAVGADERHHLAGLHTRATRPAARARRRRRPRGRRAPRARLARGTVPLAEVRADHLLVAHDDLGGAPSAILTP